MEQLNARNHFQGQEEQENPQGSQLRFTKRKSCLTNQMSSCYQITNLVDEGRTEGGLNGIYTQREVAEKMESYSSAAMLGQWV